MVTHHIISILTSEAPFLFSVRIIDVFLLEGAGVVMSVLRFMFMAAQGDILKITDPNQYFIFVRNQLCYHVLTRCENEFDKVFN
jgi:hypothetical protein